MAYTKQKHVVVAASQNKKFLEDMIEAVNENRQAVYGAEESKFVFNSVSNALTNLGAVDSDVAALTEALNSNAVTIFKLFTKLHDAFEVEMLKFRIVVGCTGVSYFLLAAFEQGPLAGGSVHFFVRFSIAHATTLAETVSRVAKVYDVVKGNSFTVTPEAQYIYDIVTKNFSELCTDDFPLVAISENERLSFFQPGKIGNEGLIIETSVLFDAVHIVKPNPPLTVVK